MLQKLKNNIIDLIFPEECLSCGKIGETICPICREKIVEISPQLCPFCKVITPHGKLCKRCRKKYALTGVVVYGYYQNDVLGKAVKELKYQNIFSSVTELAGLLGETIKKEGVAFDYVCAAPISRKRLNERGYNQSDLLAKEIARIFKKPYFTGLVKTRDTKPQVGLTRRERQENLVGTIKVIKGGEIAGQRILLIDDVITTGATLDECARALREAGARQVWGAALARE